MKPIRTAHAPAAIGPYSQGYLCGNLLFTSGQIALDPTTGTVVGEDIESQTRQAIANLAAILKEGGSDFAHVIKTTCYLSDMEDFAAFNKIYEEYFTSKPARSCVAVKTLPKGVKCEIEAIAEVLQC